MNALLKDPCCIPLIVGGVIAALMWLVGKFRQKS